MAIDQQQAASAAYAAVGAMIHRLDRHARCQHDASGRSELTRLMTEPLTGHFVCLRLPSGGLKVDPVSVAAAAVTDCM